MRRYGLSVPSAFDTVLYGLLCNVRTITAAPVVVELARAASRHFSINGRKMYSELGGNFYEACICCIKSLNTLSILKCEVSASHTRLTPFFLSLERARSGGRALRSLFPYAKISQRARVAPLRSSTLVMSKSHKKISALGLKTFRTYYKTLYVKPFMAFLIAF